MMDSKELILNARMRENCFRMLSACFYEPDKTLFTEGDLFPNLLECLEKVCPEAVSSAVKMKEFFESSDNDDLHIAYSRLFIGPFELLAPPYGSVYLDEGGRVMGDSTMEVVEIYQNEGLSKSDDFKDLPDHITVELEFMSFLIYKEVAALESSDTTIANEYKSKQEFFMGKFIRSWVPALCSKIREGTDNGFYSALADCVNTFVMKASNGSAPA